MNLKEKYQKKAVPELKKKFGFKSDLAAPRLIKTVINIGLGTRYDAAQKDIIKKHLALITGQKPADRKAKKSIASFKIRKGAAIGLAATLRGKRMYDFLDRLVNIALPRTKDFRGISANAVDEMGNYTLGIKENTIFPESSDEDLKDVFGLAVTIVTNVKNKDETKAFLTHLGFPFKKQ